MIFCSQNEWPRIKIQGWPLEKKYSYCAKDTYRKCFLIKATKFPCQPCVHPTLSEITIHLVSLQRDDNTLYNQEYFFLNFILTKTLIVLDFWPNLFGSSSNTITFNIN